MKLFGRDLDRETAVVAEIGVNHEGSLDKAIELLRLAHAAGADAVKFQTYTAERFIASTDPERLARVRSFDLGEAGFRRLAAEGRELGIPVFSTCVSEDVIPLLAELFPVIKIASGDLNFRPMIAAAAETGLPIIISTGLGTDNEIADAVGWFRAASGDADIRDRLVLMQCVAAYPVPIEQANVRAMAHIAETTGLRCGYSNHVAGIDACLAAISLGAPMVEVHFTDQKDGRDFRDHALSCDPDDLKRLVEAAPRLRASLGNAEKVRQEAELPGLAAMRKGIVAARDLTAGTVLGADDVMFARPADHIPASEVDSVIGRTLGGDVALGHPISRSNVGLD